MSINFLCRCGERLLAKDSLAGKIVKCPKCGDLTDVPKERNDVLDILDEEGVYGSTKCPDCIPPHQIICVKCGYNKKLGRKMKTKRP